MRNLYRNLYRLNTEATSLFSRVCRAGLVAGLRLKQPALVASVGPVRVSAFLLFRGCGRIGPVVGVGLRVLGRFRGQGSFTLCLCEGVREGTVYLSFVRTRGFLR